MNNILVVNDIKCFFKKICKYLHCIGLSYIQLVISSINSISAIDVWIHTGCQSTIYAAQWNDIKNFSYILESWEHYNTSLVTVNWCISLAFYTRIISFHFTWKYTIEFTILPMTFDILLISFQSGCFILVLAKNVKNFLFFWNSFTAIELWFSSLHNLSPLAVDYWFHLPKVVKLSNNIIHIVHLTVLAIIVM